LHVAYKFLYGIKAYLHVADIFTRMLIKAASNNLISSLSEENDSLSKTLYDPCYYVELYDPCYYVELLTEVFCAQMKCLTTTRLNSCYVCEEEDEFNFANA